MSAHVDPGQPDQIADQRDPKEQHVHDVKTVAGLRPQLATRMWTLSVTAPPRDAHGVRTPAGELALLVIHSAATGVADCVTRSAAASGAVRRDHHHPGGFEMRRLLGSLGLALLVFGSVALPAAASCGELADAALYHGKQGNYDYGSWLLQLAIDQGCF
jgi:hypothetical protein